MATETCAFCGRPAVLGAWVELRLYLGPGDKIGELDLKVCSRHLERMKPAYELELVECRVTRWEPGQGRATVSDSTAVHHGCARPPGPAATVGLAGPSGKEDRYDRQ